MAAYYVYSGAAGAGTGASWADAFTTLATAFTTEAAGDTLYVAHDHSETSGGALTLAASGTIANPTKVICVDRGGSVPPVSADRRTTAAVTSASTFNFGTGVVHYDGIIFTSPSNLAIFSSGVSASWLRFDNCSLRLSAAGSQKINVSLGGGSGNYLELNNTTASFNSIGHGFTVGGLMRWCNTPSALIGALVPTTTFASQAGAGGELECIGVDLSAAGSGKTLVGATSDANCPRYRFIDCKLNASVTKSAVPTSHGSTVVDFIRSGSSGVNYTIHRHRISGLLIEETTIVRTGGASDGTTPIAWKIVTTATCTYSMPFECPPIAIWNDTDGSAVTATVEGIWGGGAVPNDDEIWLEVEYLGDNSSPQGSFVNDGKADLLTTAAGQTSSSETWGGSTTKFKLAVTFTPQQAGWIYARVKVGKASSTLYVDPLVVLS